MVRVAATLLVTVAALAALAWAEDLARASPVPAALAADVAADRCDSTAAGSCTLALLQVPQRPAAAEAKRAPLLDSAAKAEAKVLVQLLATSATKASSGLAASEDDAPEGCTGDAEKLEAPACFKGSVHSKEVGITLTMGFSVQSFSEGEGTLDLSVQSDIGSGKQSGLAFRLDGQRIVFAGLPSEGDLKVWYCPDQAEIVGDNGVLEQTDCDDGSEESR